MVELLEGTRAITKVSLEEIAKAYAKNNHRGYNSYELLLVDGDKLVLSSPLPPNYEGTHHTIWCEIGDCNIVELIDIFRSFENDVVVDLVEYNLKEDIKFAISKVKAKRD